ncbi:MAG: monomethylamine:corrinoid methyltransferase [Bacteroidetes bacterium]|nr:monomethylamine:corrinoid methyltransferase [Bacteroidota bacterium]MCL5026164.1 monomethylamine:corrinoid methyltransferase [Chloroflexota bacterium]
MISLLDVAERTQKGPKMDVNDWDMGLFKKISELVKKYDIAYPGQGQLFNMDDALAGRAFRAAVELLTTYGTYCLTTSRIVQHTEEEVLAACREAPNEIIVGADRDARRIWQHKPEGNVRPNQTPGHHAPFTEDVIRLVVKNFAQIPTADYLEGINFTNVDGREVYGMPIEAYTARREAAWLREGIRKAGRPGMAIAYYPISTRSSVLIAPMDPDYGVRRTDGLLLSTLPDMQIEQDLLTAGIVYGDYGSFKVNGGGAGLAGGFCGDFKGTIVESIAKSIHGWICYRDTICNTGVGSIQHTIAKTFSVPAEQSWAASVVAQALTANTNIIHFGCNIGSGRSGPGTATHLQEIGLGTIVATICGAGLYIVRQGRAQMNAAQTPLEAEWAMEVAEAVVRTGLNRASATEVMRPLMADLEGKSVEAPQKVTECYDLVHHLPGPAYRDIYLKVKDQFAKAGLNFG